MNLQISFSFLTPQQISWNIYRKINHPTISVRKVAKIGFTKSKDLCVIYITRYHHITFCEVTDSCTPTSNV